MKDLRSGVFFEGAFGQSRKFGEEGESGFSNLYKIWNAINKKDAVAYDEIRSYLLGHKPFR